MLSIRTRGKKGIYYIRGSVSLGDKHIEVQEFSLRTTDRDAAAHLMAEHETKLRHQLMFGPAALVAQGTIADAFESYLTKAKPPCASDILRIGKLNGIIGDFSFASRSRRGSIFAALTLPAMTRVVRTAIARCFRRR